MATELQQFSTESEAKYNADLKDIYLMAQSNGWIVLKEWINEQIRGLDHTIDNCNRDDVDKPRGQRKAYRDLLDYIQYSIDKFKEITKS